MNNRLRILLMVFFFWAVNCHQAEEKYPPDKKAKESITIRSERVLSRFCRGMIVLDHILLQGNTDKAVSIGDKSWQLDGFEVTAEDRDKASEKQLVIYTVKDENGSRIRKERIPITLSSAQVRRTIRLAQATDWPDEYHDIIVIFTENLMAQMDDSTANGESKVLPPKNTAGTLMNPKFIQGLAYIQDGSECWKVQKGVSFEVGYRLIATLKYVFWK